MSGVLLRTGRFEDPWLHIQRASSLEEIGGDAATNQGIPEIVCSPWMPGKARKDSTQRLWGSMT